MDDEVETLCKNLAAYIICTAEGRELNQTENGVGLVFVDKETQIAMVIASNLIGEWDEKEKWASLKQGAKNLLAEIEKQERGIYEIR